MELLGYGGHGAAYLLDDGQTVRKELHQHSFCIEASCHLWLWHHHLDARHNYNLAGYAVPRLLDLDYEKLQVFMTFVERPCVTDLCSGLRHDGPWPFEPHPKTPPQHVAVQKALADFGINPNVEIWD